MTILNIIRPDMKPRKKEYTIAEFLEIVKMKSAMPAPRATLNGHWRTRNDRHVKRRSAQPLVL